MKTACLFSAALGCEKVYVGENSMYVVQHWIIWMIFDG